MLFPGHAIHARLGSGLGPFRFHACLHFARTALEFFSSIRSKKTTTLLEFVACDFS